MKVVKYPKIEQWAEILQRPVQDFASLDEKAEQVFKEVREAGDAALLKFTSLFDRVDLDGLSIPSEDIAAAGKALSPELKAAIATAKKNIEIFHQAQENEGKRVETTPGVECWWQNRPIDKVGIYIPGGTAPLFSTVLMLGVPAALAGCKEVILCTPPGKDGKVDPAILYTAQLVGVTRMFRLGGMQAIAAMAFGTESIPAVYKIFGPGNQYVTAAKQRALAYGVAIDMPAGPSEVLVIADKSSEPAFVAADLLSQAEHGGDSQVVLVTWEEGLIASVMQALESQLQTLPRKEIAKKALEHSRAVIVKDKEEALALSNFYAPEHLIISVEDEDWFAVRIQNAGSVFLGKYTPESAGDYASGTNHTLPTNGAARAWSGVNLSAFQKQISFQRISPSGLQELGPAIEKMAAAELLEAHKNAISVRLAALKGKTL